MRKLPEGFEIEDGVYYNKYMPGNQIKMPKVLDKGLVDYPDGTEATEQQMAKDVVTFLDLGFRATSRGKT